MFASCFVVHCLVSFLVLEPHPDGEQRSACLALFVFLVSCNCIVLWLFLTVQWVGLQCVSVVFLFILTCFLQYKPESMNKTSVTFSLSIYRILHGCSCFIYLITRVGKKR